MMDRQMMIGILGQMPTEMLLKALSVVSGGGAEDGGMDPMAELAVGAGNKIKSWNERSIPYKGGSDRPTIADKKWAQGEGGVGGAQNPRMGQLDDGIGESNIFLQTGGGA